MNTPFTLGLPGDYTLVRMMGTKAEAASYSEFLYRCTIKWGFQMDLPVIEPGEQREYILSLAEKPDEYAFILLDPRGQPAGMSGLHEFDPAKNSADLGVMSLEPDTKPPGFGKATAKALIEFGLNTVGLQQITAWTWDTNLPSLGALRRVGFVETHREKVSKINPQGDARCESEKFYFVLEKSVH